MSSDLAIFGGKPVRVTPFPNWPRVTDEIKYSVINTLENDKWGVGSSTIDRFNDKFSQIQDAKYSIALHSGTSASWVCLKAAGIEAGDEVIVNDDGFSTKPIVSIEESKVIDSDVDVIHPHTDRGYHFVNNILVEG